MKVKNIKRHCFFPMVFLAMFFFAAPVITNAQLSFSINPEKFDLELGQEEIYNDKIKIFNFSPIDLLLNVQVVNFSAGGEKGEIIFPDNDDISFNARQWIEFEEKEFVLPANSFKEIKFKIGVPANAEAGGYYLTAFFRSKIAAQKEQAPIQILSNIGALFLLRIKGGEEKYPSLDKQFELIELNAPNFIEYGPININFRLKNNDPVHIRVGGELIIYDFLNKVKEKIKIQEQTILPRKIRFFEIKTSDQKFFDKFFIGPYRAELILSTKTWQEKIGNGYQVVSETNFWAFPWRFFLILIMVILIIVLLTLIFKRKKKFNDQQQK